ncbi:uncharacterized protein LOC130613467 [Hydractinia symbiolongicarpus]|uniref:uncharacterized protein LOC130613467 n=1 Tax=Hydractinia symbiolongicarpus TaxID=13093 RepID=UPI00254A6734|nr:uncharacterized protein LOC130613467 [Hydractinia symbiolongicarpus]
MKVDFQELVHQKLDWDDTILDNLRPIWESIFNFIKELDASHSMVCVAIYGRFLGRNGQYSCQLLFGRTRSVPKDFTQPRTELYAAVINTHTGETVRRALKEWDQSSIKFTDIQIVLHWIENEEKPLKQYVRNRVVETRRFTEKSQWFYVNTTNMIADIGTRKGATIKDISESSPRINGSGWMRGDQSQFPVLSARDLCLNDSEIKEISKETFYVTRKEDQGFSERYSFSKYLIDPSRKNFHTIVRILAYVIKFCDAIKNKCSSTINFVRSIHLTETEIHLAESYFFKKATQEILYFVDPRKYEPISTLKDGILMYNGRILSKSNATIVGRFTKAIIIYDVHWNRKSSKHAGIETAIREVLKKVYVIDCPPLVKMIKKSCIKCRLINKKQIQAIMGQIPTSSMTIALAFYNTQLDLSGPHQSFLTAHKRTTVKRFVVYRCCSTSAVMINVMDDYSSIAFIQSFTRFSTRYGFPKKVFCDEGSQLVKGSKTMKLNFTDIKTQVFRVRSVEFETCPVGGHNVNGKVERKIKEINQSLEKAVTNQRFSILQWETLVSTIANTINNLPLAVGNVVEVGNMDLITPNSSFLDEITIEALLEI